jgi:hypothetical protein
MDYGQACRQTFIYRITEGLLVTRVGPGLATQPSLLNCVPHQAKRCVTLLETAGVQFWLPADSRRSILRGV